MCPRSSLSAPHLSQPNGMVPICGMSHTYCVLPPILGRTSLNLLSTLRKPSPEDPDHGAAGCCLISSHQKIYEAFIGYEPCRKLSNLYRSSIKAMHPCTHCKPSIQAYTTFFIKLLETLYLYKICINRIKLYQTFRSLLETLQEIS